MPTLGDQIVQIREMEGRAAVLRALSSHLRVRYISRDSANAVARILSGDGSAVSEEVVETVARELDSEAAEIDKATRAAKTTEVSRG